MQQQSAIGARLKQCRKDQELTLKAIEAKAGVSATHISEIERGKTSPTIGALVKISQALGKGVEYFLEDDALAEVCHVRVGEEEPQELPWGAGSIQRLTRLIPGARLSAFRVELNGEPVESFEHSHEGNELYLVESGRVRFVVSGEEFVLEEGDSIHIRSDRAHRYANAGEGPAQMLFFTTLRSAF